MVFATRFAVLVPSALALLGCTIPNPAFEGGGDEEIGAATDTRGEDESESGESESETGESGESTSETEGEDGETSDTIDGEATEASETGMNECADPGAPLLPFIGDPEAFPQCGAYVPKPVRVIAANPLDGHITVEECGPGCTPCYDVTYDFGVLGLEPLVDKYAALLEDPAANQQALCLMLDAGPSLGLVDGVCAHAWLIARFGGGQPVLFASHHPTLLDDAASFIGLGPQVGQGFAACDCEQFLTEPTAIDCCKGHPWEKGVPSLVYQGVEALPGDTHPIMLGGVGWQYHVAHAYTSAIGPECTSSLDGVQKSWAIVRN